MTFKDSLNAWLTSDKYKQFQQQLQNKKKNLLEQKNLYKQMLNGRTPIEDSELEQTCNIIIQFFSLPEDEKEELNWLTELNMNRYSKKELYFEFSRCLINWYFYLKNCLEREQYELAAKLRDVISIEIIEFRDALERYYADYIEADEEEIIQFTHETIKKEFGF
jgi:hypothetical protein